MRKDSPGRRPSAGRSPLEAPAAERSREAGCPRVAAVVLAAGMATRMGSIKQVMTVDGEPMVRRVVHACLAAGLAPVWVVTGHGAAAVEAALAGMPPAVRCVFNPDYAAGQAASLKLGVRAAAAGGVSGGGCARERFGMGADGAAGRPEALAVLLADQPFVRSDTLARLVELVFESGVLAAAVSYGPRRPGPPCVLRPALWPAVLRLTGDRGARTVLLGAGDALRVVQVSPHELRDIDGPESLPPVSPHRAPR